MRRGSVAAGAREGTVHPRLQSGACVRPPTPPLEAAEGEPQCATRMQRFVLGLNFPFVQRASLMRTPKAVALIVAMAAGTSGCLTANSPIVQQKLQTVSAGYTGCAPEDNVLSNVAPNRDGSGTWNATCKGKIYLCSAVATVNKSESFHCAPVAH